MKHAVQKPPVERDVLTGLGVTHVHFGALWRRRETRGRAVAVPGDCRDGEAVKDNRRRSLGQVRHGGEVGMHVQAVADPQLLILVPVERYTLP